MTQRDPEWYSRRAGKWTASRFGDLMAKTKKGPGAARGHLIMDIAIERLTGECTESFQSYAMKRGLALEDDARIEYEALHGAMVEEIDFMDHPRIPMCGCSPDGLIGDDGMLEIKCPAAMAKHLAALRSGAHAVEYKWQIQGQLWVAGRDWNDAVSYDPRWPEPLQIALTRCTRDEKMIAELEREVGAAEAEVTELVEELRERMG